MQKRTFPAVSLVNFFLSSARIKREIKNDFLILISIRIWSDRWKCSPATFYSGEEKEINKERKVEILIIIRLKVCEVKEEQWRCIFIHARIVL